MAGTVVETKHTEGPINAVHLLVTADAAAATVPDTVLSKISGTLLELETNPGATAPTANYDITLVDEHGIDVLQGLGANRHTTTTEKVAIVYSGTIMRPVVTTGNTLTLNIDNNAVNSAIIEVVLYFEGTFGYAA